MTTLQNLNVFLEKIKNIVIQEKFELLQSEIDTFILKDFDLNYINQNDSIKIKDELELIVIFSFVNSLCGAMTALASIRKIIDPIFIKHLWFINRFFKSSEIENIGTLSVLPDLVLFEIQKIIYDEM
jgi:hypothetical protein